MKSPIFDGNERGIYPPLPSNEVMEYFDLPGVARNLARAHRMLEIRIVESLDHIYQLRASGCGQELTSLYMQEVNGLCCALRDISGTKYVNVNFSSKEWMDAHRG